LGGIGNRIDNGGGGVVRKGYGRGIRRFAAKRGLRCGTCSGSMGLVVIPGAGGKVTDSSGKKLVDAVAM
jgi:hypothetical protein